jgi:hypothetical protein
MNHSDAEQSSQKQENILQNIQFGDGVNTFQFAPVQIENQIKTQSIQISVEKVAQRSIIKVSPYKGLKRFNFG